MSAALLEHFDLLAGSVGGVAKLRELILSLAVRGGLVPQNPRDEPASELLKKIRAEKDRLIAEGKIKRDKPLAAIGEAEKPYELPEGWEWVRLGAALKKITDGTHHSPPNLPSGDFKYISAKNIKKPGIDLSEVTYVTKDIHDEIFSRCDPELGDVLYIKDGATTGIGTINTLSEPFSMLSSVALLKPSIGVLNKYLMVVLDSPFFYAETRAGMTGVAITRVTLSKLNSALLPLPPLAEQSRIVAKVEALMALCDRLEAGQGHAARVQGHWVEAALDQLAESADADEFRRHWQHLAAHFDTLFTTPESIDRLDATLLQLAVRGKLVPQDPTDEPASELLKQIRAEKDRLIAEGKIKRDKPLPPIADDEKAYELPAGWEWTRTSELTLVSGGIQKTPRRAPIANHYPYLRVANVQRNRLLLAEIERFELTNEELEKLRLRRGDLLVVEGNGSAEEIGRCAKWSGEIENCVHQNHLIRVRPLAEGLSDFLLTFLNSPAGTAEMKRLAITTSGLYNLSVSKIQGILVPLPPLAEQSRIVAQVESLQTLTASLKARLSAAQTKQAHLRDALIADVC